LSSLLDATVVINDEALVALMAIGRSNANSEVPALVEDVVVSELHKELRGASDSNMRLASVRTDYGDSGEVSQVKLSILSNSDKAAFERALKAVQRNVDGQGRGQGGREKSGRKPHFVFSYYQQTFGGQITVNTITSGDALNTLKGGTDSGVSGVSLNSSTAAASICIDTQPQTGEFDLDGSFNATCAINPFDVAHFTQRFEDQLSQALGVAKEGLGINITHFPSFDSDGAVYQVSSTLLLSPNEVTHRNLERALAHMQKTLTALFILWDGKCFGSTSGTMVAAECKCAGGRMANDEDTNQKARLHSQMRQIGRQWGSYLSTSMLESMGLEADIDHNGMISTAEETVEAFKYMDTDHSCCVSAEEWGQLVSAKTRWYSSTEKAFVLAATKELARGMDMDGDGCLSFLEFTGSGCGEVNSTMAGSFGGCGACACSSASQNGTCSVPTPIPVGSGSGGGGGGGDGGGGGGGGSGVGGEPGGTSKARSDAKEASGPKIAGSWCSNISTGSSGGNAGDVSFHRSLMLDNEAAGIDADPAVISIDAANAGIDADPAVISIDAANAGIDAGPAVINIDAANAGIDAGPAVISIDAANAADSENDASEAGSIAELSSYIGDGGAEVSISSTDIASGSGDGGAEVSISSTDIASGSGYGSGFGSATGGGIEGSISAGQATTTMNDDGSTTTSHADGSSTTASSDGRVVTTTAADGGESTTVDGVITGSSSGSTSGNASKASTTTDPTSALTDVPTAVPTDAPHTLADKACMQRRLPRV
jgi:hypothetical protein